ncbi:MdtA/MuxA family multidrug efflux RND transporter periplasmic adaptor subunit [Caldimonas sp. KR1-144]|uniref:MdtA/MuxA family multidrug efflux RND transporter periplasmic adaptor subunit n=1 Tax=Caldimonas sp. KR1-144 TaxID=3400911 RepID=UPI003C0610EC
MSIEPDASTLFAGRQRRWIAIAVVLIAIAAAFWFWRGRGGADEAASTPGTSAGAQGGPGGGRRFFDPNRAMPVIAATARVAPLDVRISALGTVTPRNTVTVHPRVDGQLARVLFREGQIVKAGDVLAEIDPRPFQTTLANAEGQLARDLAQLQNAEGDLARYRSLLAQDSIARQQVDNQEALVRQYQGTVAADRATVADARLQLGYTRVLAPIGGRVGLRQVDAGNLVRGSDTTGLVVITEVQPISVVFPIAQDHLPAVLKRLNAGAKLAVEAWDREGRIKLGSGMLLTVDNQIDVATGTVKLKAEFPNTDGALFPNQFVNVKLLVDTLTDAIQIPSAGVQRGAPGTFAYVVKQDSTVTMRPLKLGQADGDRVAVVEGLQAGERVVIDGADRLRDGAKVEVIDRRASAVAAAASMPGGAASAPPGERRRRAGSDAQGQ